MNKSSMIFFMYSQACKRHYIKLYNIHIFLILLNILRHTNKKSSFQNTGSGEVTKHPIRPCFITCRTRLVSGKVGIRCS